MTPRAPRAILRVRTGMRRGRSARGFLTLALALSIGSMEASSRARADGPATEADSAKRGAVVASPPRPSVAARARAEASLQLRWRAPYGAPRSTDRLMTNCADTSVVDTLFVTFQVPRTTPACESLGVVVFFHPLGGDTLGPFWHFKRGWENQTNLMIDFESMAGVEGELPWRVPGQGVVDYDHRSGRGRLQLGFFVPKGHGKSLSPGVTYTGARIRIRHRRSDLMGCAQRVCVEASDLELRFATPRRTLSAPGDQRRVTWNSPEGAGCVPPTATRAVRPWRPK